MLTKLLRFIERGRKGYCREDLWSFDHWLSRLIAKGLREFKEGTHTYPNDIDDWEEWMAVLDEMIECFEEQCRGIYNISGEFVLHFEKRRGNQKEKLHRGLELLEKYFYDLWD